jgi:hypothetical protein
MGSELPELERRNTMFGLGGFLGNGMGMNHGAAGDAATIQNSMMGDLQSTAAQQMRMQTEMGQINMMMKLNEALAKMFKAIGDAVKGLAG